MVTRFGTFVLYIFAARYLGAEDFGYFSFINAFILFLLIFVDFGINFYAVREVARAKNQVSQFLADALLLKILFGLFGIALIVLGCLYWRVSSKLFWAFLFAGFSLLLDSINKLFGSIFLAFEQAEYQSFAIFLERSITLGLGLAALIQGLGLPYLFVAYVIGHVCGSIWLVVCYRWKIAPLKFHLQFGRLKALFTSAIPFAMNILLGTLAFKVDILMLKVFLPAEQVGIYSSAVTLFIGILVVGEMYRWAIYPVMSRQFKLNQEALKTTIRMSVDILVVVAVPIAIIGFFNADFLIRLLFKESFVAASSVLQVFLVITPIAYLNQLLGVTLTSIDRQSLRPIIDVIIILVNVVFNALFIPLIGLLGAAIATAIANLVMVFIFRHFIAKYFTRLTISKTIIVSGMGGVCTLPIFFLFAQNHFILIALLALVVYFVVHLLAGTPSTLQVKMIFSKFR